MKTRITETVRHLYISEEESYAMCGNYSRNGNYLEILRVKSFWCLIWIPYATKGVRVSTDNLAYNNCAIGNYVDNIIYFGDNWQL